MGEKFVKLFKDGGDGMGIETNHTHEGDFLYDFYGAIEELIDEKAHTGDWAFQFSYWIPCAIDIVLELRGDRKSPHYPVHRIIQSGRCSQDCVKKYSGVK